MSYTYVPRGRKRECRYCHEEGHYIRTRKGELSCPKLIAKEQRKLRQKSKPQPLSVWSKQSKAFARAKPKMLSGAKIDFNQFSVLAVPSDDELEPHAPKVCHPKELPESNPWSSFKPADLVEDEKMPELDDDTLSALADEALQDFSLVETSESKVPKPPPLPYMSECIGSWADISDSDDEWLKTPYPTENEETLEEAATAADEDLLCHKIMLDLLQSPAKL